MRRSVRLPLEQLAPYLLEVPDPPTPLSWPTVFCNHYPVEIEVGFGKGLFLLNATAQCPDLNFLGIEIVRKYQLFTATRFAKRGPANVRLMCGDARQVLSTCVAPASVQAIHVYFPDPWWKKRHHKRRVWTPEFAQACEQALKPGGKLYAVTDVAEYFQIIQETLAQSTKLRLLPPSDEREPSDDLEYLTNFERKFRKQGKPIYRAVYEKT